MTDKRYVVPEGMMKAVEATYENRRGAYSEKATRADLEAALRWQAENPPVPTQEQIEKMAETHRNNTGLWNMFGSSSNPAFVCSEWVRRMYDEPEPEGFPVYKALLDSGVTISNDWLCPECQRVHEAILNEGKPEVPEVSPSTKLYRAFHRAWSSKVRTEGYNKDDWNKLDSLLNRCLYPQKSAELY